MELLDAIRQQRPDAPPFSDRPVQPQHIRLLVEAAARSPSHFNSQPWRFVLIEDAPNREAIATLLGASSAPPLLLAIALNRAEYKPGELQGLYSTITLGAVVQTFAFVAASLAMGMRFMEMGESLDALAVRLAVPDNFQLVLLYGLGYYEGPLAPRSVPDIHDLIMFNQWDGNLPAALDTMPHILDSEQ